VTHDEVRRLLPGYAAGTIDDAAADAVRRHIAEGCLECLHEVFARPVGTPAPPPVVAPSVAPSPMPLPPRARRPRAAITAGIIVGAAVAAVVAGSTRRHEPAPVQSMASVADPDGIDDLIAVRGRLQEKLAALERATSGRETPDPGATRAAMLDVKRELDAARDRISALKRALRRQDVDFRQKQESMEAVIARLSATTHPDPGTRPEHASCDAVPAGARDVCLTYCQVQQCDRRAGADCETLRARFEELTGSAKPPCVAATVSEALRPCDQSHVDVWTFAARAGQSYVVTADTVDAASAADLCLVGTCNGAGTFMGDDEVPCSAAPGFACPRAMFVATADTTCTVAVTVCSAGCADRRIARYELRVTGAGDLAALTDDSGGPPGEPTGDGDSTS
jgi:hypothetical protein